MMSPPKLKPLKPIKKHKNSKAAMGQRLRRLREAAIKLQLIKEKNHIRANSRYYRAKGALKGLKRKGRPPKRYDEEPLSEINTDAIVCSNLEIPTEVTSATPLVYIYPEGETDANDQNNVESTKERTKNAPVDLFGSCVSFKAPYTVRQAILDASQRIQSPIIINNDAGKKNSLKLYRIFSDFL